MLSDKELEAAIQIMLDRLNGVNRLFIRKVAAQIKTIGELNASSIHTLLAIGSYSAEADIVEINRALATATDMNVQDLMKLYQKALNEAVAEPAFQRFLDAQQADAVIPASGEQKSPLERLPPQARARIQQISNAISAQTSARMINLSNTTAVREQYRQYVDRAVTAVTAGYQSYDQARREIIRDLGGNGLKVVYESGYRRRLDTAVRQNIIDGAKQINQQASLMMGEELGFNAVEISAHLMSAPDHEPVQGRVFLKIEYEKMQNGQDFRDVDGNFYPGFRRPIAEWNCMHFATAFSTEYSIRRYDDKTLKEWAAKNKAGCDIDGKHFTTYEASQYMRELETRVRRQKDIAVAAKDAGDDELRRECQKNIDAIAKRYYQVADAAGLRPDPQRMSVEGFRRVKV